MRHESLPQGSALSLSTELRTRQAWDGRCVLTACARAVYSFGVILWELLTWRVPWEDYDGPWQARSPPWGPYLVHMHPACLDAPPFARRTGCLHNVPSGLYVWKLSEVEDVGGQLVDVGRWACVAVRADPRKHSAAGVAYATRWACAQVVIAVVDRGLRPEIPAASALPTAPLRQHSAYVALMRRCWATDPAQRPTFDAVISELRCGPACEGTV